MAQADGYIIIDTEINADGMKAGSREVEAAVRRMANSVNDMGNKAKTALNKQADAFAKLNNEYAAQERKVSELKKKVNRKYQQKNINLFRNSLILLITNLNHYWLQRKGLKLLVAKHMAHRTGNYCMT